MKLNKHKTTIALTILLLAGYGAYSLTVQAKAAYAQYERGGEYQQTLERGVPLPEFQLSRNIDDAEANRELFWAKVGRE